MASQDRLSILDVIFRQALGSFTPAYASLLLFGALFGVELSDLPTLLFTASLAAIGLSAVQRGVLRFVLRPSTLVKSYALRSAQEIMKETRATESEKVRKQISRTFSEEYALRLSREVEEINFKEYNLAAPVRAQMRSSEARVLVFMYLTVILAVSLSIGLAKFLLLLLQIDLPILTVSVTQEPILVVPASLLGLGAFYIGYKSESTAYRQIVWRTIPVFAASDPQLSEPLLERKVESVKSKIRGSNDEISKEAYGEMKERIEAELKRAKQFALEKEWLDGEVAVVTNMTADEVRRISQSVAEESVYRPTTPRRTIVFLVFLGVISGGLVSVMNIFLLPREDAFTVSLILSLVFGLIALTTFVLYYFARITTRRT